MNPDMNPAFILREFGYDCAQWRAMSVSDRAATLEKAGIVPSAANLAEMDQFCRANMDGGFMDLPSFDNPPRDPGGSTPTRSDSSGARDATRSEQPARNDGTRSQDATRSDSSGTRDTTRTVQPARGVPGWVLAIGAAALLAAGAYVAKPGR